jgi:hypothetical protein
LVDAPAARGTRYACAIGRYLHLTPNAYIGPSEPWRPETWRATLDIYFSTVVRWAPLRDGGEVVHLDWDTKRVQRRHPVYPADPEVDDPNPRGGARGGRGLAIVGDEVVVASYHTLHVYDRTLEHRRDVSHPLLAGLHELHVTPDGRLWVAATAIDAAFEVDIQTGDILDERWPRDDAGIQARLGVDPLDVDKEGENRQKWLLRPERSDFGHLHLNTVTTWQGELYALCNFPGVIVNLDRNEVVLEHAGLRGGHNLIILDDGTAFTSGSTTHAVAIWDLKAGKRRDAIRLQSFPWVRKLTRTQRLRANAVKAMTKLRLPTPRTAQPLFVRGMDLHGDDLWVGVSPGSILRIDWQRGELLDAYNHSPDVRVCIHGLGVGN